MLDTLLCRLIADALDRAECENRPFAIWIRETAPVVSGGVYQDTRTGFLVPDGESAPANARLIYVARENGEWDLL